MLRHETIYREARRTKSELAKGGRLHEWKLRLGHDFITCLTFSGYIRSPAIGVQSLLEYDTSPEKWLPKHLGHVLGRYPSWPYSTQIQVSSVNVRTSLQGFPLLSCSPILT